MPRKSKVESKRTYNLSREAQNSLRRMAEKEGFFGLKTLLVTSSLEHYDLWKQRAYFINDTLSEVMTIRTTRGGRHVFLMSGDRADGYIPEDHMVFTLCDPRVLRRGCEDQGFNTTHWGLCSYCGRPLQYTRDITTKGILTVCHNVLPHSGMGFVCPVLKVESL